MVSIRVLIGTALVCSFFSGALATGRKLHSDGDEGEFWDGWPFAGDAGGVDVDALIRQYGGNANIATGSTNVNQGSSNVNQVNGGTTGSTSVNQANGVTTVTQNGRTTTYTSPPGGGVSIRQTDDQNAANVNQSGNGYNRADISQSTGRKLLRSKLTVDGGDRNNAVRATADNTAAS